MKITFNPSALGRSKWYEYAVRFIFGGLITAVAGIIAKLWGPTIGGLFLAFPAIFPASATLLEKHHKEKKQRLGLNGTNRAREDVSVEAAGAAIGSLGLLVFALVVWLGMPRQKPWIVLSCASLFWGGSSVLIWYLRKRL